MIESVRVLGKHVQPQARKLTLPKESEGNPAAYLSPDGRLTRERRRRRALLKMARRGGEIGDFAREALKAFGIRYDRE